MKGFHDQENYIKCMEMGSSKSSKMQKLSDQTIFSTDVLSKSHVLVKMSVIYAKCSHLSRKLELGSDFHVSGMEKNYKITSPLLHI